MSYASGAFTPRPGDIILPAPEGWTNPEPLNDDDCDEHPCTLHGRCHCMCPCQPDWDDNCEECRAYFAEA